MTAPWSIEFHQHEVVLLDGLFKISGGQDEHVGVITAVMVVIMVMVMVMVVIMVVVVIMAVIMVVSVAMPTNK